MYVNRTESTTRSGTDGNDSRRTRILDLMEPIFLQNGFSRITTDEIARTVGISKKTLYQEFASKSALVHAVVHRKLARVESALVAASEDARDHEDLFGTQLWTVAREVYTVGQPFLADLKKHEGALWEHVNAFRRRQIYSRIQESTRVGKRHGTIREEVEPRILAEILVTLAEHLLTPDTLMELDVTPRDLMRQIGALLSHGVLTNGDGNGTEEAP